MGDNYFVSDAYLDIQRRRRLLNNRLLNKPPLRLEPKFNLPDMVLRDRCCKFSSIFHRYMETSTQNTPKKIQKLEPAPFKVFYNHKLCNKRSSTSIRRPTSANCFYIPIGLSSVSAKLSERKCFSRKGRQSVNSDIDPKSILIHRRVDMGCSLIKFYVSTKRKVHSTIPLD